MLNPGCLIPFQIRMRGISESLFNIPCEMFMGKQQSCRLQRGRHQPQQSLRDPPQAQKHGSGLRDLITWQLAPMIGRILVEFGFYL